MQYISLSLYRNYELKFSPMAKKSYLRDEIAYKLAKEIASGKIFPGEKLTEISLSKRFGVSRTPLREALMLLEKQGFVEYFKNAGATVRKIGEGKLLEIIDVCAVLEGRAIELALLNENINQTDIVHIEALQESMERFVEEGDYANYIICNIEFHEFFIKKCRNDEMRRIHDEMNERILVYRRIGFPPRSADLREFLKSHRSIITAIRDGDTSQARLLLENHVREGRQTLTLRDMEKIVE